MTYTISVGPSGSECVRVRFQTAVGSKKVVKGKSSVEKVEKNATGKKAGFRHRNWKTEWETK